PQLPTLFPYTTLFRSDLLSVNPGGRAVGRFKEDLFALAVLQVLNHIQNRLDQFGEIRRFTAAFAAATEFQQALRDGFAAERFVLDRKSTRLNSSHVSI